MILKSIAKAQDKKTFVETSDNKINMLYLSQMPICLSISIGAKGIGKISTIKQFV